MYSADGKEQEEGDRTKIQLDGIEDAKSEIAGLPGRQESSVKHGELEVIS